MNGQIIHTKRSGRHFETRRWNIAHQKQNLKAGINQVEPSQLHLATGRIELSIQETIPLDVVAGVMSHMRGSGGKRLTYITVYRVCDQKYPGDITAWKQQHNIQYEDDTACVGKIDSHKQTLVDLEYFVHELIHKFHDVEIFIEANQNDRQCYRPQGHADHFESKTRFNIDDRIDGSVKTFLENTGLYNALNNKHGSENLPPTKGPGSKVIHYVFIS
jgi:hypothetical protein